MTQRLLSLAFFLTLVPVGMWSCGPDEVIPYFDDNKAQKMRGSGRSQDAGPNPSCVPVDDGISDQNCVQATPTPPSSSSDPSPSDDPSPTPSSDPRLTIDEVVGDILTPSVEDVLRTLASPEFEGRAPGTNGGRKTLDYVTAWYGEIGLEAPFDGGSYLQEFSSDGSGSADTANVVGILQGNDATLKNQVIVVGAHHDHLGKRTSSYYPGADDNASGTTALLNIAKALARLKGNLKRTVVFVAFGAEEVGLVGSEYYASHPVFPMDQTVYMLNLDMVGYLRSGDLKFLGGTTSTVVADFIRTTCEKYPSIDPSLQSSSGGGSDHVPFKYAGVPHVFVHTGLHDYYHTPQDTADRVNFDGLRDVTKISLEVVWMIAVSPESPRTNLLSLTPDWDPRDRLDHGVRSFIE